MEMSLTRLVRNSIVVFLRDHLYVSIPSETLSSTNQLTFQSKRNYWSPAAKYADSLYGASSVVDVVLTRSNSLDSNGVVPADEYTVNYLDGSVLFNEVQEELVQIAAAYSYNWADFEDAWDEDTLLRPVVSVESGPSRERGLELGGGQLVTGIIRVNVFALNVPQRDDMADAVRRILRREVPLIDFNSESILNSDGTYNTSFDPDTQVTKRISTDNIEITPNPTGSNDENERNRALIEFKYQVVDY